MGDTNPLQERETINSGKRNAHRFTELLKIADETFRRHAAARQFGREIQEAILDDEGRSRRWALEEERRAALHSRW
jgi:hypothetical protein